MEYHLCLRNGCRRDVPVHLLACPIHWVELPVVARLSMVNALAEHGDLSDEYADAVRLVAGLLRSAPGPAS